MAAQAEQEHPLREQLTQAATSLDAALIAYVGEARAMEAINRAAVTYAQAHGQLAAQAALDRVAEWAWTMHHGAHKRAQQAASIGVLHYGPALECTSCWVPSSAVRELLVRGRALQIARQLEGRG